MSESLRIRSRESHGGDAGFRWVCRTTQPGSAEQDPVVQVSRGQADLERGAG